LHLVGPTLIYLSKMHGHSNINPPAVPILNQSNPLNPSPSHMVCLYFFTKLFIGLLWLHWTVQCNRTMNMESIFLIKENYVQKNINVLSHWHPIVECISFGPENNYVAHTNTEKIQFLKYCIICHIVSLIFGIFNP